jgi:amino acid transporter
MVAQAGWWTLPAIGVLAVPFIVSSFVFRLLNRHFPHSGASYHWSARIIGRKASRYQAWILIVAYFLSIPPIAIPASSYTLALLVPGHHEPPLVAFSVTAFWVVFAAVPLLLGARPTARLTKVFFAVEMLGLVAFAVVGVASLGRRGVPVHFGPPPWGGILVVCVVAATILDGWEIDSYASEESRKPREHPGVGGVIGAFGALGFYAVLYPLMLSETPLSALSNSVDPLAVWASRVVPSAPSIVLLPILASTAGGLWLTTFILTRALYAMGRENLVPSGFGRLNRRQVPHVAIITTLGAALAVVAGQLFARSLGAFFNLVLSGAGFFLLAEFFLDSLTATIFLSYGHRRLPDVALQPHSHRWLLAGAVFSTGVMGALLVGFFVVGPHAVGSGIDWVLAALLALGVVFAWATRRRSFEPHVFEGRSVP